MFFYILLFNPSLFSAIRKKETSRSSMRIEFLLLFLRLPTQRKYLIHMFLSRGKLRHITKIRFDPGRGSFDNRIRSRVSEPYPGSYQFIDKTHVRWFCVYMGTNGPIDRQSIQLGAETVSGLTLFMSRMCERLLSHPWTKITGLVSPLASEDS